MKKIALFLVLIMSTNSILGQVGIGIDTPDNSAALHIESTTHGFLPPRMNTIQRDAITVTLASKGLIIYNLDSNVLNIFDGITWHAVLSEENTQICNDASTYNEFLSCVQTNYTPNQTLGYSTARDILYSVIDVNTNTQELKGIYSNYTILMDYSTDPDPSIHAFNLGINAEHVIPQSMGAGDEPARSDMMNLFPARIEVNSSRGNCPFNEITDSDTESWFYNDQQFNTIPTTNIDLHTEKDQDESYPLLFITQQCSVEPQENKKGDIARAAFYFYTIYNSINVNSYTSYANDDFFNYMKSILLTWHINDPVDQLEINRNNLVETYQGNSNPFILDSTLAQRMFN